MVRISLLIGAGIFKFLICGLFILGGCQKTFPKTLSTPEGFDKIQDWSVADRELRVARSQGMRFFQQKFPETPIQERDLWLVTPVAVWNRSSSEGIDWLFRFEDHDGKFIELIVLARGGIEGLDAGGPR